MASFFDNLRNSLINNTELKKEQQPFYKTDPINQKRWNSVDWRGLDERVRNEIMKTPEQKAEEIEQRGKASARGTTFLERDFNLKNDPSSFDMDPQTEFFSNLQIAQSSNRLNKIVDKYEQADGWDNKKQVIRDGYNSFSNKTPKLIQWFDNFARLTERSADPNDSFNDAPEEIAGAMRYYLTSARDKFFKKS